MGFSIKLLQTTCKSTLKKFSRGSGYTYGWPCVGYSLSLTGSVNI